MYNTTMIERHLNATDPLKAVAQLRKKIQGGSRLLLDSLSEEELEAMQQLLFSCEAEIVSSACKPFLRARLERVIIE